jgi:hypothetical protein
MTVKELIETLEAYNPTAKVELLIQPNYPLRVTLAGLTSDTDIANDDESQPDEEFIEHGEETTVYLLEGGHLGYGPRAAWAAPRR